MSSEFAGSSAQRQELKRLVELYSLRARELSEALAGLGSLIATDKPIADALTDVAKLRAKCDEAGTDLHSFVKRLEECGTGKGENE